MDIQQLRYFVEIVNCANFTRAAQKMNISQPGLTRAVKNLESELNTILIERDSKSFRVTDTGRVVYAQGVKILEGVGEISQMVADLHALNAGEVHISVPSVLLTLYFPNIIGAFSELFPNIKIFVRENPSKLVIDNIMDGDADIGFVMLPAELGSLTSHAIISDICSTVLPKESDLAWEEELSVQKIKHKKIATFTENATLHDVFIQACRTAGFEPNIIYKSMSIDFLMDIISTTGCVGVLPSPVIRHYIKDTLKEIPLTPAIPWDIALIYDQNRYRSHACKKFIDFISAFFCKLYSTESD